MARWWTGGPFLRRHRSVQPSSNWRGCTSPRGQRRWPRRQRQLCAWALAFSLSLGTGPRRDRCSKRFCDKPRPDLCRRADGRRPTGLLRRKNVPGPIATCDGSRRQTVLARQLIACTTVGGAGLRALLHRCFWRRRHLSAIYLLDHRSRSPVCPASKAFTVKGLSHPAWPASHAACRSSGDALPAPEISVLEQWLVQLQVAAGQSGHGVLGRPLGPRYAHGFDGGAPGQRQA